MVGVKASFAVLGVLLAGGGALLAQPADHAEAANAVTGQLLAYTAGYDANLDGIFSGPSEENGTDIWTRPAAGGGVASRLHPANGVPDITPSFSPDGTKIAWASAATPSGTLDIMVKDLGTGEIRNLTSTGNKIQERWPTWSPDGERIVYNRRDGLNANLDIWIMDADGGNPHYVAGEPGGEKMDEDCCASFTPDGSAVVFASNRLGQFDVYRYDLNDGSAGEDPDHLTRLTDASWYEGTPSVESSGTVLYRSGKDQHAYRLDPDTAPEGARTRLEIPGQIRTPQGIPGSTSVVLGWRPDATRQLDIIRTDALGGSRLNLTRTPGISETDPTIQPR